MQVGDLVRYETIPGDSMDRHASAVGLVVQMSRTGHKTKSAQILFQDGTMAWFDSQMLEVVSASR